MQQVLVSHPYSFIYVERVINKEQSLKKGLQHFAIYEEKSEMTNTNTNTKKGEMTHKPRTSRQCSMLEK